MSVHVPYIFTNAFASIVSNAKQRDPVAFFKRSETELVSLTHFCLRVLLLLRPCICFNVCLIMHNCDSACLHATWSVCKSRSLLFFNEGMHWCREQVNHLKALFSTTNNQATCLSSNRSHFLFICPFVSAPFLWPRMCLLISSIIQSPHADVQSGQCRCVCAIHTGVD